MTDPQSSQTLRERVAGVDQWYHTLELAPGLVTPGWFDTRAIAPTLPMPASLSGKRCLDVGTFDGFWAFEMERRGASEVVAIDVLDPSKWDWPAKSGPQTREALAERKARGAGFLIASEALGSKVTRLERSIYELNEAEFGQFDFVYVGSLLLHLRDPVGGLMRVREVCRGQLLLVDAVDLWLTVKLRNAPAARLDGVSRPWWWTPTVAGLARMVDVSGFDVQGKPKRFYMPPGPGVPPTPFKLSLMRTHAGREAYRRAHKGDAHAAVLATASPNA